MVVVLLATACVPGRPTRTIEAEVVGVVSSVSNPIGDTRTVEFEDGRSLDMPLNARAFTPPPYNVGRLLLSGVRDGRMWYASLGEDQLHGVDGCYTIDGVAYDEPDSVIVVSGEWRGVGLRLPKRADFVFEGLVDEDGLYRAGGEYPESTFCVDVDGFVMGLR